MEDKKLLYGILAVCVVTLVVSGISVYEVNTVAKQLNTQGEQIAALEQSRLPQNVIIGMEEPEVESESEDVEETPEEDINSNYPPENQELMPAEESISAIDADGYGMRG